MNLSINSAYKCVKHKVRGFSLGSPESQTRRTLRRNQFIAFLQIVYIVCRFTSETFGRSFSQLLLRCEKKFLIISTDCASRSQEDYSTQPKWIIKYWRFASSHSRICVSYSSSGDCFYAKGIIEPIRKRASLDWNNLANKLD